MMESFWQDARFLHGGLWPESYDLERSFGVILTHNFWKRRFGGDPNALGRKITHDATPFYVIHGVAPLNALRADHCRGFRRT